jgi:hypothetical protein
LEALKAAFNVWEASLDNTIHFRLEPDPMKAGIRFTFRPEVKMGQDQVAGLTKWTRDIRVTGGIVKEVSFKADVNVRTRSLESRPMSFEAIRQESEHELGHVLGLDDSDRLGDLMGQLDAEIPVAAPRDYEILAVRNLRDEARRVKQEAHDKGKVDGGTFVSSN